MIFVDANIFVDVLSSRDEWYESSAELINRISKGMEDGYISALTIPVLWYVLGERRELNRDIIEITKDFKVVALDSHIIKSSFDNEMRDFEDAIQLESAKKAKCRYLITRNKKDFVTDNKIDILTPEEFLAKV